MTTIALLGSSSLLGKEVQETLERNRALWSDLRLLSRAEDEEGLLASVGGAAALVHTWSEESLSGVDLLIVSGEEAAAVDVRPRPEGPRTTLVVSPAEPLEEGVAIVAGINPEAAEPGRLLVSPHPAVIALAQLLAPLRRFGLRQAHGWLLQPASTRGQSGLDELLEQTRSILSFQSDHPRRIFGRQLAFSLFPDRARTGPLVRELRQVLGGEARLALRIVQIGVFHSFGFSVYVDCAEDPGVEGLREALGESPFLEFSTSSQPPAPIDAAAHEKVLLGEIEADPEGPGGYWLWGVMDNLTRGGALNALAIAEALLGTGY